MLCRRILPTILLACLILLMGGCSEEKTPVVPQSPAGVTAEIVDDALLRVDYQRSGVESWLSSWQEYAGRPGVNWNYSETETAWVMMTNYYQSQQLDGAEGMTEVRRETSEQWRITLLRGDLPVRDWASAERLVAQWTGRYRYYALDEDAGFLTPFDFDYAGEVRAEIWDGQIQTVAGEGALDGWQTFLRDHNEQHSYRYTSDFTLDILLDENLWRCPGINLAITMAVQDALGNPLDEYAGALAMPAGDGHYTGRVQSQYNEWVWVVNARRSCSD